MNKLLLIPLDDTVVLPNVSVTLAVDVGDDDQVLLLPRHESRFASVGVVAEVEERVRLRGRRAATLSGLHRARVIGAAEADAGGNLRVAAEEHPDPASGDERTRELEREYRAVVEEILDLRGDDGRIKAFVRSITEPGALADTAGYSPEISFEQKLELLETLDPTERLDLALRLQRERPAELQVRKRSGRDVGTGAQRRQREYSLRQQMDAIRRELGEDDESVVDEYRTKLGEAGMPEAVREQAEKELSRLERLGEQSAESSVIRTYLDW